MKSTIRELSETAGRGRIAFAAALAAIASTAALVVPWLVGTSVEALTQGNSFQQGVALIVGLLAVRLAFEFWSTLEAGRERYRTIAELRQRWYAKMLAVPPGYETDEHRQDWVSVLSYDIPRIAELAVDLPIALTQATLTLVGALVVMSQIDVMLTALVFGAAPVAYLVARLAVRAMRRRAERYWDVEVDVMSKAETGLASRWSVLAFGQSERFVGAFEERAQDASIAGVDHLRLLAFIGPAVQFVTFLGMALIVLFAASDLGTKLSTAQTLSFVLYGLLLSSPLRAFADGWTAYHEVDATLARFEELQRAPAQCPDGTLTKASFEDALRFEGVAFGWRDDTLFDGLSLEVSPGEIVALVGENGAGKSTLVSLLLGFASPDAGRITIDGTPLDELSHASRRGLFAVAPQHAALVSGTIIENVRFARPDATAEEVGVALQLALADFVDDLPNGLQTRVGEGGLQLSGGQRQRIAIARAILTKAPILILDEATSGFDAASSRQFLDQIKDLPHHSVVWITHEEAVRDAADRVLKLDSGVILG